MTILSPLYLLFFVIMIGLVSAAALSTEHHLAHSFYSNECCQEKDCRPVPCSEIRSIQDGWQWRDKKFTTSMLRMTPDGKCHVCVGQVPACIYLPPAA